MAFSGFNSFLINWPQFFLIQAVDLQKRTIKECLNLSTYCNFAVLGSRCQHCIFPCCDCKWIVRSEITKQNSSLFLKIWYDYFWCLFCAKTRLKISKKPRVLRPKIKKTTVVIERGFKNQNGTHIVVILSRRSLFHFFDGSETWANNDLVVEPEGV